MPTHFIMRSLAAVVTIVFGAHAAPAHADGAFPDSQRILVPEDRPDTIVLATNFGLVISEDGGARWLYACETLDTSGGRLYSLGPAPEDRVYAISTSGVAASGDLGCGWSLGGGFAPTDIPFDVFPDPVDATHLLVATLPAIDSVDHRYRLYESRDSGATYAPRADAPIGDGQLTGVEIARADPNTWYLTFTGRDPVTSQPDPWLVRTTDGGASWQSVDLAPMLGPYDVYIAAVGRADPRTLFLRVLGLDQEGSSFDQIATSFDGGDTVAVAAAITGARFTAVLEREDGTVLATGWTTPPVGATTGATPLALRSEDAGRSFAPWSLALHVRALAERGGTLFAAAADTASGEFAFGASDDGGASWTPRLRFKDIAGIRPCLQSFCFADCQVQVAVGLFKEPVCSPDGGTSTDAPPAGGAGCACSAAVTASRGGPASLPAALAVAALAALTRRRRPRFTAASPALFNSHCRQRNDRRHYTAFRDINGACGNLDLSTASTGYKQLVNIRADPPTSARRRPASYPAAARPAISWRS